MRVILGGVGIILGGWRCIGHYVGWVGVYWPLCWVGGGELGIILGGGVSGSGWGIILGG